MAEYVGGSKGSDKGPPHKSLTSCFDMLQFFLISLFVFLKLILMKTICKHGRGGFGGSKGSDNIGPASKSDILRAGFLGHWESRQ